MTYGAAEYGAGLYAGPRVEAPDVDTKPTLAVEIAFTTDALDPNPAWVDITTDVRSWNTFRGRNRELERFQPGRATVVLGNLSRQYDSVNAAGPWFGFIKPMRRIRIRETFNGVTYPVFDGFIDRWQLDYPNVGTDATATVTATDAFKIFARTDLPRSVYTAEVVADSPRVWWRLDETQAQADVSLTAYNAGSGGSTYDGTFVGSPKLGSQTLVVHEPGTAMQTTDSTLNPGTPNQGVETGSLFGSILDADPWAIEVWCRPEVEAADATGDYLVSARVGVGLGTGLILAYTNGGGGQFSLSVTNNASTTFTVVSATGQTPWKLYHIVAKHDQNRLLSLYVNGVKTTGSTMTGATTIHNQLLVAHNDDIVNPGQRNWRGTIDEVAIYQGTAGVDPLSDARVAAHYAAGTAPWQSDQPGTRLGRVLDLAEWPSALREIDAGNVALQSAELGAAAALEHAQKVGETEFGLLFVTRDGTVRLIGRAAQFARTPGPAIFGDSGSEVGYRELVPDDGDEVIRNRATISRLNGVAKSAEDAASVDEFGRFDYTLEGLLHSSDTHSQSYATFIVAEYKGPRRRITSLRLGPPAVGAEATLLPLMLGVELGDAITVRNRPPGGGATFEQVCVVEGIEHDSPQSSDDRTTALILSPEFSGSF